MSRCRSCGAEIKWIKMRSGKSMPVDPELYTFAKFSETPDTFITSSGETVKGIPAIIMKGYIPHWATCPKADEFRRK